MNWAMWPWNRCRARFHDKFDTRRCDLKRHTDGVHVAEEGMYDITWTDKVEVLMPRTTP